MKKTVKILKCELWAYYGIIAVMAALFESGLVMEGAFAGDEYAAANLLTSMWVVAITLVCIPVALKLFSLKYVKDQLTADESRAPRAYLCWGTLRLMLLGVPMVASMLCYYLFGAEPSFFYLAVIIALAICFVWPSEARANQEVKNEEGREKN